MNRPALLEFQVVLNLGPFAESLRSVSGPAAALARPFLDLYDRRTDLHGPLNPDTLRQEKEVLETMAATVFSPIPFTDEYSGLMVPFDMSPLITTPALGAVYHWKQINGPSDRSEGSQDYLSYWGYGLVLSQFFGVSMPELPPQILWFEDDSGFPHAVQVENDSQYLRLSQKSKKHYDIETAKEFLFEKDGLEKLKTLLPQEDFVFEGFLVLKAVEVTDQALTGELKYRLIDQTLLLQGNRYDEILSIFRNLLRKNSVQFKLVVRDREDFLFINTDETRGDCRLSQADNNMKQMFRGSLLAQAFENHRPVILERSKARTPEEKTSWGHAPTDIQSSLVVPLVSGTEVNGVIMLSSTKPGDFSLGDYQRLQEVWPLLSLAVRRATEEFDHQVESIIQKHFTAIHPSVAWRFRDAASEFLMERQNNPELKGPASVSFEEVYPLYALSDVRNSSVLRIQAIVSDLGEQLRLAEIVLEAASGERNLIVLDEIRYRIKIHREKLTDGLGTGDENGVITFLKQEFEPLLGEIITFGPSSSSAIKSYRKALDAHVNGVYRRRKELDESIRIINETAGALIEDAQIDAQAVYPHYFDKTSTDGVDQNIYIGPAMAENRTWQRLYLQNLRLWQFIVLARCAQRLMDLKPSLPIPLDMTHLIMVQDLPLSIYFRLDEKRFAVEGAYNIRYELIKKRIDKATVKGSGERLTQIGKIAVVYSRPEEEREYKRYIEYLQNLGYLEPEVEVLELEDLQGVLGLKAFRVSVLPSGESYSSRVWEEVKAGETVLG